jgi:peptidoglycan/LPS O-acetylase OafA/YrhL
MEKLDWIDALRGYAILGVIFVHSLLEDQTVFLAKFWSIGHKGVELFFIVSAFTLLLSFYRRKDEQLALGNFFIRRFFRIAPMFYLALVYYLFQDRNIDFPASYHQNASPANITAHALLLNGISPHWINSIVPGGWSVGAEVLFYMLCPFLFKKITSINRAMIFYFVALIVGQAIYYLLQLNPLISDLERWELFLYYFLPSHLYIFFLGFIAYYTCQQDAKTAGRYIIVLIASCALLYVINYFIPFHNNKLLNNNLFGICCVIAINVLSRYRIPWVVNPAIKFLGTISFSVYLSHFAALHLLNVFSLNYLVDNSTQNFLIRMILILAISMPISYLTYRFVEVPFQNIGRRIINKRSLEKH